MKFGDIVFEGFVFDGYLRMILSLLGISSIVAQINKLSLAILTGDNSIIDTYMNACRVALVVADRPDLLKMVGK